MNKGYVLIVNDPYQIVCGAYRSGGYEAYSVSKSATEGGHPEWHIMGDVMNVANPMAKLDGTTSIIFGTCDDQVHEIDQWDVIIPSDNCTHEERVWFQSITAGLKHNN